MLVGVGGIAYSFYKAFLTFAEATGKVNTDSMDQILEVLYTVIPFLAAIIIIGAVIVISNAFSISANEQIRQFGILKSVGATKKQIRKSVMSEGRLMSAISIPVGILVGYIVTFVGMLILNKFLGGAEIINNDGTNAELVFRAAFHIPTLFGSVVLAFITIMLSAYRVARKVSKLPAIDAVKQKGEVVVKANKTRTLKLTGKIFGFEGILAAKSLKRAKRKYRATVVSIVASIVLVIISASFGQMLYSTADEISPEIPGNVRIGIFNDDASGVEELLKAYKKETVEITVEPDENSTVFHCLVKNAEEFCSYAEVALPSLIAEKTHISVINVDEQMRQVKSIYTMLMIFIYCFVGMLAAVGVTGVLATIGSNIALRTSEFAVLQAVGMDNRGLRRMLNLESLLYGLKSLIIGIPLGLALSFCLHRLFLINVDFIFDIPWLAILICIIGVFAVIFISMRYATSKLRRGNIAEAMRAASM
jgi:ABC-type antimicrobial peptide transport system permease subunit